MERRNFEELDDFEDEEYTLDVERDIKKIRITKKEQKWYRTKTAKVVSGAIALFTVLYFMGNWILFEFNYVMTLFNNYMQLHPIKGILLYQILFICGMQIFIPPGTFITITTPTFMKLYGPYKGIFIHMIIVYFTEHTAIFVTYYLGRNCCRVGEYLSKKIEYFDAFNRVVMTKGSKITFLLRLCLIIPYDVINYIMSTTDIPLFDYFIGNHGMIMDFIVSTYVGISISKVSNIDSKGSNIYQQIFVMICGTALIALIIWYVIRTAQNEFDRLLKEEGKKKTMFDCEKLS